jgi:hypothetical protein
MPFKSVSDKEVEVVYSRLSDVLMGEILVKTFRREADLSDIKLGPGQYYSEGPNGSKLYALTKKFKDAAIVLEQTRDGGILDLYSCSIPADMEEFLNTGNEGSVFIHNLATISTMPRQAGQWSRDKGYKMVHEISIDTRRGITLPSEKGRWFVELMSWISNASSEYLDVSEQPTFWDMEKRNS